MQIISHRGFWNFENEKNKMASFEKSFSAGFGIETDIRDFSGELVISHDPPVGNEIRVEEVFHFYRKNDYSFPLALNIKADGLQHKLKELIEKFEITNYFVFDMSFPDLLIYSRMGMNTFSRQSEWEEIPLFYDEVDGIWLDCFEKEWVTPSIIETHLKMGKFVCIVSPELHKREYECFWNRLRKMDSISSGKILLCTDYPQKARSFFYE